MRNLTWHGWRPLPDLVPSRLAPGVGAPAGPRAGALGAGAIAPLDRLQNRPRCLRIAYASPIRLTAFIVFYDVFEPPMHSNKGSGGRGGAVTAVGATATITSATGGHAYAYAHEVGGAGGAGSCAGKSGGAGGLVSMTTAKASGYSARAEAVQVGGAGGSGAGGANGGVGAASALTNAATGTSKGGYLVLDQLATGGADGGSSASTGGVGERRPHTSPSTTSPRIKNTRTPSPELRAPMAAPAVAVQPPAARVESLWPRSP
jgi:hypothetical protein